MSSKSRVGLLTKFYTNPVAEHPNDWSVAIAIEYKSWETLDEMGEKAAGIAEKHYGSRQAMADAAKKRNEMAACSQYFTRPRSNLEITDRNR
jgi:hypothetical protein